MAEKKLDLEKALLEVEQIEKTFQANSKEILSRTMGTEIEQLVKESLEDSTKAIIKEEEEETIMELDLDLDLDSEEDESEDLGIGDMELDMGDDDSDDVMDLTDAEDEEVQTVFQTMGPDDEIEVVVKDSETDAEYKIEISKSQGDSESEMGDEMEDEDETEYEIELDDMSSYDDDLLDEEETIYEVELEEGKEGIYPRTSLEKSDSSKLVDSKLAVEEDELEEQSRTLGAGSNFRNGGLPKPRAHSAFNMSINESRNTNPKLISENRELKSDIKSYKSEIQVLKEQNEEYVSHLKDFRNKLQEVAVFNANLTNVTRLFTEHSTSKQEKMEILNRFDNVSSLKESKSLYKQIVSELGSSTKSTIKESVEEKINETKGSGASQITESKVYENPQLTKMKKLMNFEYGK